MTSGNYGRGFSAAIFALSLATITPVAAQSSGDIKATQTRITAGEWMLGGIEMYMGADGCLKGETYTFTRSPQTVRIKHCVAGKWQVTQQPWSLRPKPPTDIEVLIGATPYVVKFRTDGTKRIMVLRSRAGPLITARTTDRIFRLSED